MTQNTPNYTIPYPEITDYVKDGATAMENIAERVDDVLFAQVANRNLLYNGAMQIAQRSTSAVTGITTTGYYTIDRWSMLINSLGTWTQTPDTDVPTGQGFRRSLKVTCTTADATPAAGDYFTIRQMLEGQDLQPIRKGTTGAKQLTLAFWVKANKTGTYIVQLWDTDNSRQVCKSYTINSSATWEYKTLTFPADTTGAFNNDNELSLEVRWWLGAGSNYTSGTLATTWASIVDANTAVGQANLADAVNNYWQVTGTQLLIGSADAPFEFKSYQQDLCECHRFYYKLQQRSGGIYDACCSAGIVVNTSGVNRAGFHLPVPTRRDVTNADISYNALTLYDGVVLLAVTGGAGATAARTGSMLIQMDFTATLTGLTIGNAAIVVFTNDTGYFIVNQEL